MYMVNSVLGECFFDPVQSNTQSSKQTNAFLSYDPPYSRGNNVVCSYNRRLSCFISEYDGLPEIKSTNIEKFDRKLRSEPTIESYL